MVPYKKSMVMVEMLPKDGLFYNYIVSLLNSQLPRRKKTWNTEKLLYCRTTSRSQASTAFSPVGRQLRS